MTVQNAKTKTKVWDLPTRMFHWLLVLLFLALSATGLASHNAIRAHIFLGLLTICLICWRVIWGLWGSYHSKFSSFVCSPVVVGRYITDLLSGKRQQHLGHNPVAGWMVVCLLSVITLQVLSGLFGSDGIALAGPLAGSLSSDISELLGKFHIANYKLLLILVVMHVLAVFVHLILKDNVLTPMITGVKSISKANAEVAKEQR